MNQSVRHGEFELPVIPQRTPRIRMRARPFRNFKTFPQLRAGAEILSRNAERRGDSFDRWAVPDEVNVSVRQSRIKLPTYYDDIPRGRPRSKDSPDKVARLRRRRVSRRHNPKYSIIAVAS